MKAIDDIVFIVIWVTKTVIYVSAFKLYLLRLTRPLSHLE